MYQNVKIENYKSIEKLELELGRVTVLIGANGSGKSNILEALALASAALADKLDHEFLGSRGIRVTDPPFMRAAFEVSKGEQDIAISLRGELPGWLAFALHVDPRLAYPRWMVRDPRSLLQTIRYSDPEKQSALTRFLIYAPEYTVLRTFESEGQILPLGIRGEGLFRYLKALSAPAHRDKLQKIQDRLQLIDWFAGFDVPGDLAPGERTLRIQDRFLSDGLHFDQRSANEGFLYLLFYFTLLISPETPTFFAIDNVDSSLNPKLCRALVQELVKLTKENNKQVILTTHNPAVLDGLDLSDDEQRLLVVERTSAGRTRTRRVHPPRAVEGQAPLSLSEAFMRGYIGGLPDNF